MILNLVLKHFKKKDIDNLSYIVFNYINLNMNNINYNIYNNTKII